MTIQPFGNNVLIRPSEVDGVLKSDQGTLCEYGTVLAVGPDVKSIHVGDVIGFLIWGVNKLVIGNDTHYFIPESPDFILGTINETL